MRADDTCFLVPWIVAGLNPARAGAVESLSVSGGGLERRTRVGAAEIDPLVSLRR
jgi:hypothetical protein